MTGDITWKLRCKSFHAYGCPAACMVVYRKATGKMHLEVAAGWEHKHENDYQRKQTPTGDCNKTFGLV